MTGRWLRCWLWASCLWASGAVSAPASVLMQFDFTGLPGDQAETTPSWTATGVTATPLERDYWLEVRAGANSMNSRAWATGEVIRDADYYEWSIAPTGGATLDIHEIAFGESRNATGIRGFTLRSSLDGFLGDVVGLIEVPDTGDIRSHTLVLGSAFDAITSPVTFRLYGFFAESLIGQWAIRNHAELGAFSVLGTVTLPGSGEPAPVEDMHAPEPTAAVVWGAGAGIWGIFFFQNLKKRPVNGA